MPICPRPESPPPGKAKNMSTCERVAPTPIRCRVRRRCRATSTSWRRLSRSNRARGTSIGRIEVQEPRSYKTMQINGNRADAERRARSTDVARHRKPCFVRAIEGAVVELGRRCAGVPRRVEEGVGDVVARLCRRTAGISRSTILMTREWLTPCRRAGSHR